MPPGDPRTPFRALERLAESMDAPGSSSSPAAGSDTRALRRVLPRIGQGSLVQGNIDLSQRPEVHNPDGTVSSVYSISIGTPQGEVIIPTVSPDGRIMDDEEAIQRYETTGEHLGIVDTPENATALARAIHNQEAMRTGAGRFLGDPAGPPTTGSAIERLMRESQAAEQAAAEEEARRRYESSLAALSEQRQAPAPGTFDMDAPNPIQRFVDDPEAATGMRLMGDDEGFHPGGLLGMAQDYLDPEGAVLRQSQWERRQAAMEQAARERAAAPSPLRDAVDEASQAHRVTDDATAQPGAEETPTQPEDLFLHPSETAAPLGERPQAVVDPVTGRVVTGAQMTIPGPVSQEALARAQAGVAGHEAAMDALAERERDLFAGKQAALEAEAQSQENMIARERIREARVQEEITRRLGVVDSTLEAVRNGSVDPREFFGGPLGVGVGVLAIALGQIGQAIGGGPNTALEIINSGIENSIRAQEAGLAQDRAALAGSQQALGMFRAITGDQRAAEETLRLAAMEATRGRLRGMLQGLTGEREAAAVEVLRALEERTAAQRAVAEEANRGAVTIAAQQSVAGAGGVEQIAGLRQAQVRAADEAFAVRQLATQTQDALLSGDPEAASAAVGAVVEQASTMVAGGRPDLASSLLRETLRGSAGRLDADATASLEAQLEAAETQAEQRIGPLLSNGWRDTSVEGRQSANRARTGGRRQQQRDQRRRQQRSREVSEIQSSIEEELRPLTREEFDAAQRELASRAPPGFRVVDETRWAGREDRSPEERRERERLQARVRNYDTFLHIAAEARRIYGGEVFPASSWRSAYATRMRELLTAEDRHELFGSAVTENEQELSENVLLPDPTDLSPAAAVGLYDPIYNNMVAHVQAQQLIIAGQLVDHGIIPDSDVAVRWYNSTTQSPRRRRPRRPVGAR